MAIEVENLDDLFHIALPWYIEKCAFDEVKKQLDVYVSFQRGAVFCCSQCGAESLVYDIADDDRTWRHLNFLEHPCYIHAEMPRTKCGQCGKIRRVEVPWAVKSRANFTRLFDEFILTMAKDMPMKAISRLVNEHDTQLWRIVHYYVDYAVAHQDLSHVTMINTDETSAKKGHQYVTIFMDSLQKNVIHVSVGKDAGTWSECKEHLEAHGGTVENVKELCMDMSKAFIKGASDNFPDATITFDKFHMIQSVNRAVDEVRRNERKTVAELKNTRYIWLKNEQNLTAKQKATLDELKDCHLDTAEAYRMKIALQEIYQYPASIAEIALQDWISWGLESTLEPMKKVAQMVQAHYSGVMQWFHSKLNNGILEGINSLIQATKRKARGYRSHKNLITMIYLLAGKLDYAIQ